MLSIAAVTVAAVVGITAYAISNSDSSPSSATRTGAAHVRGRAEVGGKAPQFELPGLDGTPVSLAAYRRRPVVITFWASWCQPCRREFPLLRDGRAKYRKDGLEVIGVTYQDIPSDSRDFAREMRATWPLASDESGAVARAYGVRAIPVTFFVRRDGTIAALVFGLHSAQQLDDQVAKILRS